MLFSSYNQLQQSISFYFENPTSQRGKIILTVSFVRLLMFNVCFCIWLWSCEECVLFLTNPAGKQSLQLLPGCQELKTTVLNVSFLLLLGVFFPMQMLEEGAQHFQPACTCVGCCLQICSYPGNPAQTRRTRKPSMVAISKEPRAIIQLLLTSWGCKF